MAKELVRAVILSSTLWLGTLAHAASPVVAATPPQPRWATLSAQQQTILAPLASDWDSMENYRRKKWLAIAARYPTMTANAQQRMQERMREWASLPPEIRRDAREKFKEYNRLTPEAKEALKQRWQEYKQQEAAKAAPQSPAAEEKR